MVESDNTDLLYGDVGNPDYENSELMRLQSQSTWVRNRLFARRTEGQNLIGRQCGSFFKSQVHFQARTAFAKRCNKLFPNVVTPGIQRATAT